LIQIRIHKIIESGSTTELLKTIFSKFLKFKLIVKKSTGTTVCTNSYLSVRKIKTSLLTRYRYFFSSFYCPRIRIPNPDPPCQTDLVHHNCKIGWPSDTGKYRYSKDRLPAARLDLRKNSFAVRSVRIWHELPDQIKSVKTKEPFKMRCEPTMRTVGGLRKMAPGINSKDGQPRGCKAAPKCPYAWGDGGSSTDI
jgi:hypothetical protein